MLNKYQSLRAQIDMLYNLVFCFLMLFFLAFLQFNPEVQKKGDIVSKAEFMIEITWPDQMDTDIDAWLKAPDGKLVSYRSPNVEVFHLERDDYGLRNDSVIAPDGKVIVVSENKEVIMFRGYYEGVYVFNVMVYNSVSEIKGPIPVQVKITKLNPYQIITDRTVYLTKIGEEQTGLVFRIEKDGTVSHTDTMFTPIIFKQALNGN
jgi:hypothetical protein